MGLVGHRRHGADLDQQPLARKHGLHGRARRAGRVEVLPVDLVERAEVAACVRQEADVLDGIRQRGAGRFEKAGDPRDDRLGLRGDVAVDRFPIGRERDLARDEDEVAHPHRGRIWETGRRDRRARDDLTLAHWILPRAMIGQTASTVPRPTQTYCSCRFTVVSQWLGTSSIRSPGASRAPFTPPCSSPFGAYWRSGRPFTTGRPLSVLSAFHPASMTAVSPRWRLTTDASTVSEVSYGRPSTFA